MIRLAKETDISQILEIYGPYVLHTAVSFEYSIPTLEEFTDRFRSITSQFPWLVWEEAGQVLGYAYGSLPFGRAAYRWCAASSIYLAPEAQGQGIGRRLYAALEDILQKQGYRLLYAIITSENTGSLAFHEKLGYRHLAQFPGCAWKSEKRLGIHWMQKELEFDGYPNSFPFPWNEVVKDDKKFL